MEGESAPVPGEYLPPWHKVHAAEPLTSLYDPATHAEHDPPSGPVCPMLQMQSEMVELPTPEKLKEGQIVHVAADVSPISAEYLPSGHLMQALLHASYTSTSHKLRAAMVVVCLMYMYRPAPSQVTSVMYGLANGATPF